MDLWGRRWESDRYLKEAFPKAAHCICFPRSLTRICTVPSARLFPITSWCRNRNVVPLRHPFPPGVYELKLYFADPLRQLDGDEKEKAQDYLPTFRRPEWPSLLVDFDPVSDGGPAAVDVRVFKDVRPAADGKVHLGFRSDWGRAFVSGMELTPGTPGKLEPIRIRPSSEFCRCQWHTMDRGQVLYRRTYLHLRKS